MNKSLQVVKLELAIETIMEVIDGIEEYYGDVPGILVSALSSIDQAISVINGEVEDD